MYILFILTKQTTTKNTISPKWSISNKFVYFIILYRLQDPGLWCACLLPCLVTTNLTEGESSFSLHMADVFGHI